MIKMDVKVFIYSSMYKTIHVLVTYLEFILNILVNLHRKFGGFHRVYTNTPDCEYISEHVKRLNKVPEHISILLGTEEPSCNNLAKLAVWCIAAGIPFISFYDYKGHLRKNEDKLQEAVEKIQKLRACDLHIIWNNDATNYKNGYLGKKIHIKTLTLSDGQRSVANVAKQLASVKTVEQQVVDTMLRDSFMFPDPDLALYCGKSFTMYGYPPWQMRITEFLSIGSHHDVSPEVFINALYKYSKTEQRLGK